LSDLELVRNGRIKLVSRSQGDPDIAVLVEGIGDADGDWRCAGRYNLSYAQNRLCSLESTKFFTRC
jgi:hypothetical protein